MVNAPLVNNIVNYQTKHAVMFIVSHGENKPWEMPSLINLTRKIIGLMLFKNERQPSDQRRRVASQQISEPSVIIATPCQKASGGVRPSHREASRAEKTGVK